MNRETYPPSLAFAKTTDAKPAHARRPIGFYVHHQGRGHATHAQLLIQHLARPTWVFTSRPDYFDEGCPATVVELPMDVAADEECYPQHLSPAGEHLHYAPLQIAGIRERMATLTQWIVEQRPALMFIDVSVEVATLCRLMGVPTVVVRLQGWRDDPAHLAAFASARAIYCPFPQEFEWSRLPGDLEQKCYYEGCYDRLGALENRDGTADGHDARAVGDAPASDDISDIDVTGEASAPTESIRRVLVLVGSGGTRFAERQLTELARAFPAIQIDVLGPVRGYGQPSDNLAFLGQRDYVLPYLQRADLVIGGAGNNVVMEVGACRKRFICLPEERAFGEQNAKAKGIEALGLGLRLKHWPAAGEWPKVLAKAAALQPQAWAQYFHDPSLARAAACLERLAAESEEVCKPADQKPVPSFL